MLYEIYHTDEMFERKYCMEYIIPVKCLEGDVEHYVPYC